MTQLIPTVVVVGPAGEVTVNKDDLQSYLDRGYVEKTDDEGSDEGETVDPTPPPPAASRDRGRGKGGR